MNNINGPILLEDKTRFPEIFKLRVEAWEHSPNAHLVNSKLLPNGWFDTLDDTGFHWIFTNDNNEIIASARLNFLTDIAQIPQANDLGRDNLFISDRFGYLSRLVVKSGYRDRNISRRLDFARIDFSIRNGISIITASADGPLRIAALLKYGFKVLFNFSNRILPGNKEDVLSEFMQLEITELNKHLFYE